MIKIQESKIKEILKNSKKPMDSEIIAKKLHALKYINQINSVLDKFERQGLIQSV